MQIRKSRLSKECVKLKTLTTLGLTLKTITKSSLTGIVPLRSQFYSLEKEKSTTSYNGSILHSVSSLNKFSMENVVNTCCVIYAIGPDDQKLPVFNASIKLDSKEIRSDHEGNSEW